MVVVVVVLTTVVGAAVDGGVEEEGGDVGRSSTPMLAGIAPSPDPPLEQEETM